MNRNVFVEIEKHLVKIRSNWNFIQDFEF